MSTYLGPLSAISGGTRQFYVDVSNQLNTAEKLSSIDSLVSSREDLIVASGAILSGNLTTKDGQILYSGEAVSFWANASGNLNFLGTVTVPYHTNLGTSDTTLVYLKVVPSI